MFVWETILFLFSLIYWTIKLFIYSEIMFLFLVLSLPFMKSKCACIKNLKQFTLKGTFQFQNTWGLFVTSAIFHFFLWGWLLARFVSAMSNGSLHFYQRSLRFKLFALGFSFTTILWQFFSHLCFSKWQLGIGDPVAPLINQRC